jgi:hypothetical protein
LIKPYGLTGNREYISVIIDLKNAEIYDKQPSDLIESTFDYTNKIIDSTFEYFKMESEDCNSQKKNHVIVQMTNDNNANDSKTNNELNPYIKVTLNGLTVSVSPIV